MRNGEKLAKNTVSMYMWTIEPEKLGLVLEANISPLYLSVGSARVVFP
jgi:hypothetical protein